MNPLSSEFYAKGYCLRQYDISNDFEIFRFKDDCYRVPVGIVKAVPVLSVFPDCEGLIATTTIAKIEDVKNVLGSL